MKESSGCDISMMSNAQRVSGVASAENVSASFHNASAIFSHGAQMATRIQVEHHVARLARVHIHGFKRRQLLQWHAVRACGRRRPE